MKVERIWKMKTEELAIDGLLFMEERQEENGTHKILRWKRNGRNAGGAEMECKR